MATTIRTMKDEKRINRFVVQTGTEAFLVWYMVYSALSLLFGMRSMIIWLILPICIVIPAIYAVITKRHKYLYPFLIITVIQQIVFMLMAAITLIFSLVSFNTMHLIIGHSLEFDSPPSKNVALAVIIATVAAFIVLSFVNIWQAVVIYSFCPISLKCCEVEIRKKKIENSKRRRNYTDTDRYSGEMMVAAKYI
ncbi:unnamed protein product [Angiostrongylus costaricensis]|uniref:Uncharacterized protein n=1 Tax=Angiostrongylus costaricensis TaxID=334426 RepID=A0A0R3PJ28_ANGCS|nr:unnamed protein product [Angiostrongylus costaricensis]